ncbi:hypothetical protein SD427_13850 [Chryseobacterium sp. JJR-5R]|uniref:hypothetical protein n=1 Tax=Chryseobacterium sp. JJR-5R TaxID=3093923 RepID=UPI002A754BEA|nr:hypothetical protein [Chryseobacterium sp. JJR-5R]WPO81848.1 hypothetical protein SD427_13850 [Chryseobacterium sp. JJR-5R]
MLDKEIIDRKIRYIAINDILYFDVRDIKEKTTDILVKGTRVKNIDGIPYILSKDLRMKTEFDYMMEKTLKFDSDKEL